jgi:Amino acid transporters
MGSEKRGVFLRESSGLVREFGIADAIWFNIALVGLLFSTYYVSSTAPLVGGNPLVGLLLPLAGFFLAGYVFSQIASKVPRTAADYVYVSRNLHPALGFVGNAGYFVATVPLFMGITGITLQTFGLIPLLDLIGFYTGNPSLVAFATAIGNNPYYVLAIGAVEIVALGLLPLGGNKVYRAVQRVIIPLVILTVVLMIGVEAAVPHGRALAELNNFMAFYHSSVSSVQSSNVTVPPYNDIGTTLALNPVYVVGLSYIISTVYIAGEVKNARRNMPISILGTLLAMAAIFSVSTYLEYVQWGYGFTSKLLQLSVAGQLPIPTPYLDLLEGVASGTPILAILFALVSILQLLMYLASASFVGSRLLLSYSMDRILPDSLGDVNEKYHVPMKAVITSMLAGLVGLIIFTLPVTSAVAFLLSSVAVAIILLFPLTVVSLAALKRESSPWVKAAAAVSIPYLLFTFYQYLTVPAIGADSLVGYAILAGTFIVLFAIFYVAKAIRKRQGIEFDMIFKEIPPE